MDTDLNTLQYKKLRQQYYVLWLALFAIGLIGISSLNPESPLIEGSVTLEKIKSVLIIFTLFSIPGIFAWFTTRTKKMDELNDDAARNSMYGSAWKARIWVVFAVAVINLSSFLLTFDTSLMYVLGIVIFIFFYCRPNIVKPKLESDIKTKQ